jgi:hypothetical protein
MINQFSRPFAHFAAAINAIHLCLMKALTFLIPGIQFRQALRFDKHQDKI